MEQLTFIVLIVDFLTFKTQNKTFNELAVYCSTKSVDSTNFSGDHVPILLTPETI